MKHVKIILEFNISEENFKKNKEEFESVKDELEDMTKGNKLGAKDIKVQLKYS